MLLRLGLLLVVTGCSGITERQTLDPSTSLALSHHLATHVEVTAVNGVPVEPGIVIERNGGVMLESLHHREPLKPTDKISLDVHYHDGATLPGEGVLRVHPAWGFVGAGGVLLAAGAAFFGAAAGLQEQPSQAGSQGFNSFWLTAFGVASAATGLVLAVVGFAWEVHIEGARLSFAPMLAPTVGAAAASLAF